MALLFDFNTTEGAKTFSPVYTYNPVNTSSTQYGYTINAGDKSVVLGSSGTTITSKKEAITEQTQIPTVNNTPTVTGATTTAPTTASQGMDFTMIAIIAVVGLIAYGLIKK